MDEKQALFSTHPTVQETARCARAGGADGPFAKIFGMDVNLIKPIPIKEAHLKSKSPPNTCLNNTKAKKILGINFSTVEDGVVKVFKKSKNHN